MKHEAVLTDEHKLCREFAEKHVAELASEIVEWQDSSTLKEGKLRELAAMCASWAGANYAMSVAQSLATRAALESAKQAEMAQPLFWYRPRSDGLYEGPIHNAQIESVRKESGAWVPLHAHPPTPSALLEAAEYHCIGYIDGYGREIQDKDTAMNSPRAVYVRAVR